MKHIALFILLFSSALCAHATRSEAITRMLERIDPGLSNKIIVEIVENSDSSDWFAIDQQGWQPVVHADNAISAAVGINRYLRQFAGKHLSWNAMSLQMPDTLPAVTSPVFGRAHLPMRYYLNYCTHSYSMAFWDRDRWEKEIDWMALHGINMPLAITGSAALWKNVLQRLGYPRQAIDSYVAGPGFQAWWLMNNLEGWGGPNTDHFYQRDRELQQFIIGRMHEFGMKPVLPGYSGMLPSDAHSRLGLNVSDPGKWCGFSRPAFLQPGDEAFDSIAAIYYDELHRLYGPARFYSMDPFHEGGNADGVDLQAAGQKILAAMKQADPDAVWVVQGWQENPRAEMIDSLPENDVIILDLQAENSPMWSLRPSSYNRHPWLYCMLLNFGGNVGLYGKIPSLIHGYAEAISQSPSLAGIGLTMEGIENNAMMFDLLCDLPWTDSVPDIDRWIADYVFARYGANDPTMTEAWQLLARSVYSCPAEIVQQGPAESLFCARPSHRPATASAWANTKNYYDPTDVLAAAKLMLSVADRFSDNPNYRYDLVDVTRQAVANRGRQLIDRIADAAEAGDSASYRHLSSQFLDLILLQDSLLATSPDFRLGRWIDMARACGSTPQEKDQMEWNARTQITVWGTREAADSGRLHDYAHREWQGLLRDFYYPRWKMWFDLQLDNWGADTTAEIDFFEMEERWTRDKIHYSPEPEGDPVATSRAAIYRLSH